MIEGKRAKKFPCDVSGCGKTYSRPCLLNQHKRSHFNERPFKCDECGKEFYRDSHLKTHKWTHSGTKPLTCKVCDKGFITGQQLSRHIRSHKPKFACPYDCAERFLTEKELGTHMLEDHIISDTVDLKGHIDIISSDVDVKGLNDELNLENWDFENWSNIHCKEVRCLKAPSFPNMLDLLNHYDEKHGFVPETLVRQNYNQGAFSFEDSEMDINSCLGK